MRASRLVVLLALLLVACSPVSARNSKRFKPGPYAKAVEEEYRLGAIRNALIPANQPQQILTSLSGVEGTITVTWVTFNHTTSSLLQWGNASGSLTSSNTGASFDFIDPEEPHTLRIMHTAHMTKLHPHSTVYYRVGDKSAWSDELTFVAPPHGQSPLNLIIYGDLGLLNAVSMDQVRAEVNSGEADIVLHLGDYAYDLHTNNGTYGDTFLNNLQPIASRVPYLGCQGNHEGKWNASHYRNRFTAYTDLGVESGSGTNWWFSWEYRSGGALVHVVAINTEMYYDYVIEGVTPPDYSQQRAAQYKWLDMDLAAARKNADWVIVYGHRPMYCSDVDSFGDCTSDATVLREGYVYNSSTPAQYGMDDIIARHNVDMYFTAHEHSYERIFPVWRGIIDPQQNHTHTNPRYPVHIVTGSAGCQEYLEWFDNVNYPAWSVVRSPTYGYGHLVAHNETHLYWDQLLDEGRGGRDWLWIVRDSSRRGQPTLDLEREQRLVTQKQQQQRVRKGRLSAIKSE